MVARSSLRYLAPIALVVFTIALIVVVASSDGGGSGSKGSRGRPASVTQSGSPRTTTRRRYTVRPGDSLLAIAQKTGVPTDRLQRLNPDIDPQVLVPGQRLKLRP